MVGVWRQRGGEAQHERGTAMTGFTEMKEALREAIKPGGVSFAELMRVRLYRRQQRSPAPGRP
jgi:hypothetical protein